MRAFADSLKLTQKAAPVRPPTLHSLADQAKSPVTPSSGRGYDLSRIPLRASVPRLGQKPELASKPETKPAPASPKPAPKPEAKPKEAAKPAIPTITHETTFAAPDGTDKKRSDVGVGEKVTFTGSAAGKWTATDGKPTTLASGATFEWLAPDRAATVTIKLRVGTEEASVSIKVIEPADIMGRRESILPGTPGVAGAGMTLRFIYHPLNVSFGNVEAREVSGPASNITGYYRKHYTNAALNHNSGDKFTPIKENNEDSAPDTAETVDTFTPWEKGGFDWVIPNKFKVKTETGDGKQFTKVTQAFEMLDATGRIRITKAQTAQVERSP